LVAVQTSYDTEAQSKLQVSAQLEDQEKMFEQCQTNKSEIESDRNRLKVSLVDAQEKLGNAQRSLTIWNEERQRASEALIEECIAALEESEKQRV